MRKRAFQQHLTRTLFFPRYAHPSTDTNFINFSIQNKLDLVKAMMDCLYAKCTPCITDCVMGELEKLGGKCVGPFV